MSRVLREAKAGYPRQAIAEQACRIRAEIAKEDNDRDKKLAILSRLISDPMMERVWRELYRKRRVRGKQTEEYFHPARVTNSSIANGLRKTADKFRKKGGKENLREARLMEKEAVWQEARPEEPVDPKYSAQDKGAQMFFYRAYLCALEVQPLLDKDIQIEVSKVRREAETLREAARILKADGMSRYAERLNAIAEDREELAASKLGNPLKHDPSIFARNRAHPEIRAFVTELSIAAILLFGEALPRQLAYVANAVFGPEKTVEYSMVREWLRTPGVKKKI